MGSLTEEQLELLERAGGDIPIWGGSIALARLARDVELLFAMGLIEPDARYRYKRAALGSRALEACRRST